MEGFRLRLGTFLVFFLLVLSGTSISGLSIGTRSEMKNDLGDHAFYFVQLTDTHVMNKVFEPSGLSVMRLRMALGRLCAFEPKPAFIVITGDLTNWGGSLVSGSLNCRAFASCFYTKDGQLFADPNETVPVYTTPGNHDYFFARNLDNYHRLIKNEDRYIVNYSTISLLFMTSGAAFFGDGAGLYDSDMEWLENALDACNGSMKVVLMHHPAVNQRDEQGRMPGVLARNREAFVGACEAHHVELVLTGHTHHSAVYDGNESRYNDTVSLNCSLYPTLYVQTDDTSDNINYRNVTVDGGTVWLGSTVRIPVDDAWS